MPAKTVRLQRKQDKFITDPISEAEAKTIMDGYPGEYDVLDDAPTAAPKPTRKTGGSKKKKPPVTDQATTVADPAPKTGGDTAETSEDGVD